LLVDILTTGKAKFMSELDNWQRQVSERDRREALRRRLADEGIAFIRRYAESWIPRASRDLQAFLQSAEGLFIQQWLSRSQIDLKGMTRIHAEFRSSRDNAEYLASHLNSSLSYFGLSWPKDFHSDDFTFHAITGMGLVEFFWCKSFWRDARFRVRKSTADRVLHSMIHEFVRKGLYFKHPKSGGRVIWYMDNLFLDGTWDDWARFVEQKIDNHMDVTSRLRGIMSHALSVQS
jgi:hypothetical protein